MRSGFRGTLIGKRKEMFGNEIKLELVNLNLTTPFDHDRSREMFRNGRRNDTLVDRADAVSLFSIESIGPGVFLHVPKAELGV